MQQVVTRTLADVAFTAGCTRERLRPAAAATLEEPSTTTKRRIRTTREKLVQDHAREART